MADGSCWRKSGKAAGRDESPESTHEGMCYATIVDVHSILDRPQLHNRLEAVHYARERNLLTKKQWY